MASAKQRALKLVADLKAEDSQELAPTSDSNPYPRYTPGEYEVRCKSTKTYFDPQFRAWKCLLVFEFVVTREPICGFLHLGNGDRPFAGRRSEYRRWWIITNGDQPLKRQTMSSRIFKGKKFLVKVGDTTRRYDGRDHPEPQIYSTVKDLLERLEP